MDNDKRDITIKISVLIIVFFLIFLNFIISIIIQGFNTYFTLFGNYFITGESLFIPYLPYINLGWYLPLEYQIAQFSLGKLSDIIIIINLVWYAQSGIYLLVVKFRKENLDEFDNLENLVFYNENDVQNESQNLQKTTESKSNKYSIAVIKSKRNKNKKDIPRLAYFSKRRYHFSRVRFKDKILIQDKIVPPLFYYSYPLFLNSLYLIDTAFSSIIIEQKLNEKSSEINLLKNLIRTTKKKFD